MSNMIKQYLSLRVGTQWCGIPVESVVEVHPMLRLTDLPVSMPNVLGLMTVRDYVFPVLDLRLYFGLPDPKYQLNTPIVVLRTTSGLVGLVADDADNVESISEQQIVSAQGNSFPYVTGVARLRDRLLLLLDTMLFCAEIGALPERSR